MSTASLSTAQESFTVHLHAVEKAARFAFRRLRPQEREEALAEARAAAWQAWHGLVKRGKDPVEVGVHGIANNAIRTARRSGRNGNWTSGRRTTNVRPAKSRAVRGFHVISLDGGVPERTGGSWKEWVAADNRTNPADEAAFRIDFAAWLNGLPARKREMAELLAEGHETGVAAKMLGVTPGAVSQTRNWLAESWWAYQEQGTEPAEPALRQPASRPRREPNIAVGVSEL